MYMFILSTFEKKWYLALKSRAISFTKMLPNFTKNQANENWGQLTKQVAIGLFIIVPVKQR